MNQEPEDQDSNPDFRVQPGDVAILVRSAHWVNRWRVCQVIQRLPDADGNPDRVWWLCEFSCPIRTPLGWINMACMLDNDLQRLSLPVPRFQYPSYHYSLWPKVANALALTKQYRDASA